MQYSTAHLRSPRARGSSARSARRCTRSCARRTRCAGELDSLSGGGIITGNVNDIAFNIIDSWGIGRYGSSKVQIRGCRGGETLTEGRFESIHRAEERVFRAAE
ncbi:MAG: hypothetical protein WBW87_09650 [Candidatus Cybelea sp.]